MTIATRAGMVPAAQASAMAAQLEPLPEAKDAQTETEDGSFTGYYWMIAPRLAMLVLLGACVVRPLSRFLGCGAVRSLVR